MDDDFLQLSDLLEVRCPDCGCSLGFQQADTHIDWQHWRHTRCPVRLAAKLGMAAPDYHRLFVYTSTAIAAAYPDFPDMVLDDKLAEVRAMRADIAAGHVLEALGTLGYTVNNPT